MKVNKRISYLKTVCIVGIFQVFSLLLYAQDRSIKVDLKSVEGAKNTMFNECIGAGRANEGLRADWQQQLARVQKDINFKYIRFHGLLHDDMAVYKEDADGNPVYNWQYIDALYDYLLSVKIRPFVEFSFMPADLASGTKTIFWWKGNVTKPKSYEKWDALITALVTHWKERYGEDELRKWYFEVWNEPDLRGFFDATQADYFELYNHTVRAVKSVSPAYRVGGPATSATKWINEFLAYCKQHNLPVDFVSTHDYGTTSVLDEFGKKKQHLKNTPDTIAINVKRVRTQVNTAGYEKAELHFTEWNTSPSSRDPIHDTYFNAAYILNTLKKASLHANSMSYWTFTDIFEEAGPGPRPFHGGFGLINLQNIPKPSYYAYQFMNQLGDKELKNNDESSYVCTSDDGLQVLVWNYVYPQNNYHFNQDYFDKIQVPQGQQKVSLEVSSVKNGRYKLEVYKLGYQQNDPYSLFIEMGKPAGLSMQQLKELKQQSSGKPVIVDHVNIKGGSFRYDFTLRSNDVVFVKLTKEVD